MQTTLAAWSTFFVFGNLIALVPAYGVSAVAEGSEIHYPLPSPPLSAVLLVPEPAGTNAPIDSPPEEVRPQKTRTVKKPKSTPPASLTTEPARTYAPINPPTAGQQENRATKTSGPNQPMSLGKNNAKDLIDANQKRSNQDLSTAPLREHDKSMVIAIPSDLTTLDAGTRAEYQEALHAYYSYRIEGYRHRQRVYAWQLESAKVIFCFVLLVVLSGIYFAAVQFHDGLRRQKEHPATEIDASLKGIKVNSHVLGVVILIISLAFFYLYLVYVYPITDSF